MPNPTGIGGFQDHPELRNDRGFIKSPLYWIKKYGDLTNEEFNEVIKKTDKTVFETIAIASLINAGKDRAERQNIIDRIDGKAQESLNLSGEIKQVLSYEQALEIVDKKLNERSANEQLGSGKT